MYQDPALTPETPPDGPLYQPPLARTVTGMQPEGIHASPWQLARDGTWTLLLSWQTGGARSGGAWLDQAACARRFGRQLASPPASAYPTAEARTGPTGAAPPPHDPDSVASVVRYGDRPGALDSEVVGGKRAVYKYVYGEGAGNTTYQVCPQALLTPARRRRRVQPCAPGGGLACGRGTCTQRCCRSAEFRPQQLSSPSTAAVQRQPCLPACPCSPLAATTFPPPEPDPAPRAAARPAPRQHPALLCGQPRGGLLA